MQEIRDADIKDKKVLEFLKNAATRYIEFDYHNVAEYYAQADEQTQGIFEKLCLVIIDIDQLIEHWYAKISTQIDQYLLDNKDTDE